MATVQTSPTPSKLNQLENQLITFLDRALQMELGLSENEADYDLRFIGEKLAKCSTYLEKLSEMNLHVVKIGLEITKGFNATKAYLKVRMAEANEEFTSRQDGTRYDRDASVRKATQELQTEYEQWSHLREVVRTVGKAIGDRVQDMKRLDSDIRLQQKLLEAKVAAGATSPTAGMAGKDATELNFE